MNNGDEIIGVLNSGGVVIFPTDTAMGIGCRIDREDAVKRVFAIKGRAQSKAMPILVSSIEMALAYFDSPSDIVRRFMKEYWPGALTIVDSCQKNLIHSPIRANGETVGIRMPKFQPLLHIIKQVGVPIVGSSANLSGQPTVFSSSEIDPELVKLVDYVMEGECTLKQASTVVDCSVTPPKIVRQGAVIIAIN